MARPLRPDPDPDSYLENTDPEPALDPTQT